MKTIPYGRQSIEEDDIRAVVNVLKSDWLTQGPTVEAFEEAIATYCDARYAVVCSSGTAALHLAYLAAGLGPGDAVITTPNTFPATSNAALYVGAKPYFADIDPATFNIDPNKIEELISDLNPKVLKPKAIVPVHFGGHPCDMEDIARIARDHNLLIIEDACHAMGGSYSGRKIGGISDITVFSFHPVKLITTGEGGAVVTNNSKFYQRLKQLRTHGITKEDFISEPEGDWYYEMQLLGYNYRMTDIQAALGISQLKKLDWFISRRREIARIYNREFNENPYFDVPMEKAHAYSSYHLYPIRLKDKYKGMKRQIFLRLRKSGLGVQVHYIPVYWHPFYHEKGYKKGLCPIAEDFYQREISIPIYPAMQGEDVGYVIERVMQVFNEL